MQKYLCTIFILCILTGCSEAVETISTPAATENVVVTKVIDGDTIEVEFGDGHTERVRIIGIDSTEEGECYFEEARTALTEMIEGEYVSMARETSTDDRDEYNRLLRYVRSAQGDIGVVMIMQGYAKNYPWFPHERDRAYNEAEEVAQSEGRGMWGVCES